VSISQHTQKVNKIGFRRYLGVLEKVILMSKRVEGVEGWGEWEDMEEMGDARCEMRDART
jgi:hypothetical protein